MKRNQTPVTIRLQIRIGRLIAKEEDTWRRARSGNPYAFCRYCGIHAPQFSINGDRHHKRCPSQGLLKEIAHYERLLKEARNTP